MRLSIIVPVYNRKEITLSFLKQIFNQDFNNHYNVIVVDDGSTDGTEAEIREKFPSAIIIKGTGSWWWTRSVNEGIKYAIRERSNTVLLMNDDIEIKNDYLKNLIAGYDLQSIRGSLTITSENEPRVFFSGISNRSIFTGREEYYYKKFSKYSSNLEGLKPSYGLPGRGLLIPTWVFDKIGFFDDSKLPQYKADTDFVLRAINKGVKSDISWNAIVYAKVEQTGNGSLFKKQSFATFYRSFFSSYSHNSITATYFFYKRHVKWYTLPYVMLYATLGSLMLFVVKKCFKLYKY